MKRFFAIALLIFFLAGIVGIRYDAHYCGGELITSSLSIVPKELSCGMMNMDKGPENSEKEPIYKKHCCDNEHLSFEIDNDFNDYQPHEFNANGVASIPPSLLELAIIEVSEVDYNFIGYSPPPIERDIIVLNQTFLI